MRITAFPNNGGMSIFTWWSSRKPASASSGGGKLRRSLRETTMPLMSPRKGRRLLRREQMFSVVRESLIRAGVLSTSYQFKVLTLDAVGDSFIVLVEISIDGRAMPDEYLLEIEHWIQDTARRRHEMGVQSVYWRRKAALDSAGGVLKAAVPAQTHREVTSNQPTALPIPQMTLSSDQVQPISPEEVQAFRQALQSPALPRHPVGPSSEGPRPEEHSDFSALSETQYGKL